MSKLKSYAMGGGRQAKPVTDPSKFSRFFNLDDVEGIIGLMDVNVLMAVVARQIDLNEVASHELANRGLNRTGDWVGFDEAKRRHEARSVSRGWPKR